MRTMWMQGPIRIIGSGRGLRAVAEGGITRFLALFYCQDAGQVGPVRSARTYFVDFASEYADNPLYAHVGGANQPGPADALTHYQIMAGQIIMIKSILNRFSDFLERL